MSQSLNNINNYFFLIKFSHTVFALPFAIIGFLLAITFSHATFDWKLFVMVILCMVFARNAAMAFNRYVDRNIDKENVRTVLREIPAGTIKPNSALTFVVLNAILFIAVTYFINPLCFYLSPLALLVILGYSLTKRFTFLCHLILGLGLSLAPIGAYLAVSGEFAVLPLLFSFAVMFWVSGFDIIYALQDVDFDKAFHLNSIPVWIGNKGALTISIIFHSITSLILLFAGLYANFVSWYWVGFSIFTGLLIYQHTLVKPFKLDKVNVAFFTTNGIASIVFSLFVLLELYN